MHLATKILNKLHYVMFLFLSLLISTSYADEKKTKRIPYFSNNQVTVWETIIYPGKKQILKVHRHDHNRVLISFDNGMLKVTNNKGKIHYLKFEKDKPYYLSKDAQGEYHTDENISDYPIKVIVVELSDLT